MLTAIVIGKRWGEMLDKNAVWKVNLYTLWVTQALVNMGMGLVIPFIPYYLEEMAVMSTAQLNFYTGLSSTLPAAAQAIASPLWGHLSDRYGRKLMLVRAMICAVIVLFFMGIVNTVSIFLVLRVLQGIFTGTIPSAMALVSAHTPEDKMSYALGFMTSSNFLGYAIGPVVGSVVCEVLGYEACFYFGAAVIAVGTVFVIALVKEDPTTYGLKLIEARKAAKLAGGSKVGLWTANFVMTLIVILIIRIGRTIFSPFIALFVRDMIGGMDGATRYTGFVNMATCIATAVSSVTLTRFGDRYDKFKLASMLSVVTLVISAFLPFSHTIWLFIGVYALYYFVIGAIEPVLTSGLSEKADPGQRGALFGITASVNSVGMMISPMIGASVSTAFSLQALPIVVSIFALAQVIFLVAEGMIKKKKPEDGENSGADA